MVQSVHLKKKQVDNTLSIFVETNIFWRNTSRDERLEGKVGWLIGVNFGVALCTLNHRVSAAVAAVNSAVNSRSI